MEKGNATAAPTGCYKCGRPGHWSRDCPDSNPNPNPNSNSNSSSSYSRSLSSKPTYNVNGNPKSVAERPKKAPRTRPKLTPEILLKDDGLGFVLRHFPRNFKYHGRGPEVSDLGNLIGLYSEWHSHLLPYYSFDQFVQKVEQVAATKRVKTCLRDLRERVASGGDPTKLRESPPEDADPNIEQDHSIPAEGLNSDGFHHEGDLPSKSHDADVTHEDMLHELFDKAVEETSQTAQRDVEVLKENGGGSSSSEIQMTDEQRARMEANRLKALERAAARARSLQSLYNIFAPHFYALLTIFHYCKCSATMITCKGVQLCF